METAKLKTLEELASVANVSIATVSRALHDSPAVNDETKRHIWTLAHEHEFPLHRYALSNSLTAEATITVVIPKPPGRQPPLANPFMVELLAGISDAACERNCDLLISHRTPSNYEDLSTLIASDRADGIIFLGQRSLHDAFNRLSSRMQRFVVWGAELEGQEYCSVGSDNEGGGAMATRHLIRLGRKKILFLGDTESPEAMQRHHGYRTELEHAGLDDGPNHAIATRFELQSAESAIEAVIKQEIEFDGIVAASDMVAIGTIRALGRNGINVPADVAIVGYDNVQFARFSRPSLTSITQNAKRAGRLLVSKLLDGSGPLVSERVETSLIVRESCGA